MNKMDGQLGIKTVGVSLLNLVKGDKKSVSLGGLRISEYAAKEYKKALKHYGVRRAVFARMCIDRLIEHYQAGQPIDLPIICKIQSKRR